jgi:hypothetical protein
MVVGLFEGEFGMESEGAVEGGEEGGEGDVEFGGCLWF